MVSRQHLPLSVWCMKSLHASHSKSPYLNVFSSRTYPTCRHASYGLSWLSFFVKVISISANKLKRIPSISSHTFIFFYSQGFYHEHSHDYYTRTLCSFSHAYLFLPSQISPKLCKDRNFEWKKGTNKITSEQFHFSPHLFFEKDRSCNFKGSRCWMAITYLVKRRPCSGSLNR